MSGDGVMEGVFDLFTEAFDIFVMALAMILMSQKLSQGAHDEYMTG